MIFYDIVVSGRVRHKQHDVTLAHYAKKRNVLFCVFCVSISLDTVDGRILFTTLDG